MSLSILFASETPTGDCERVILWDSVTEIPLYLATFEDQKEAENFIRCVEITFRVDDIRSLPPRLLFDYQMRWLRAYREGE